jgi:hypothetical protein
LSFGLNIFWIKLIRQKLMELMKSSPCVYNIVVVFSFVFTNGSRQQYHPINYVISLKYWGKRGGATLMFSYEFKYTYKGGLGIRCLRPKIYWSFINILIKTNRSWHKFSNKVMFSSLLCRPTRLDLYSASPNETTMYGKTCTSTRTHYPDSEPTSLCSYSLMQRA